MNFLSLFTQVVAGAAGLKPSLCLSFDHTAVWPHKRVRLWLRRLEQASAVLWWPPQARAAVRLFIPRLCLSV